MRVVVNCQVSRRASDGISSIVHSCDGWNKAGAIISIAPQIRSTIFRLASSIGQNPSDKLNV